MRTSEQLYHRVRWDPRFDPARFVLGVTVRGAGPQRVPLPAFVPGGDVPWHRVVFVEADGELVWDRATGLDRIEESAAGRVVVARRLRAPFFTARVPHAWDPLARGWRPAPAPAADPPAGPVRVLTWNALWDRYDSDRIDTARRRPLLLAELAAADADVIALQEAEPALLALLLAEPWVRAAYALDVDPTGPDVDDTGLVLLSRLPVVESGRHALGPHKGLAAVTVRTAAGPLVVATTHLSSDHSDDGAARREPELAAIADGLAAVPGELVLVGDLNDDTARPATALRMRDAWPEARGRHDDTPTFDPTTNPLAAVSSLSGLPARLDRVLLRGPGLVAAAAGLRGDGPAELLPSDHYGVQVDLLPGAPEPADDVLDAAATGRTALVWLPPAEALPGVARLRRAHDPAERRWPPHVTVLVGFVPEAHFDRAAELLAGSLRERPPFTARLQGVRTSAHGSDTTVRLDPAAADPAPWQDLHARVRRLFPGCRSTRRDYVPHLTLGRTPDPGPLVAAARTATGATTAEVGELALLSRRGDGPMRVRATVRLGTGAVRWADEPPVAAAPPGPDAAPVVDALRAALANGLIEAVVEVVGSRRTGCAPPGADLDLVAALPGHPDPTGIADRVRAAVPGARRLRSVVAGRVPGLRFRVGPPGADLAVDLVTVPTGAVPPSEAVARRAELGEPAAIALGAVTDAAAVLAAVGPRTAEFTALATAVKAWARARGLDSAPHGGLPGIAWAVLVARTLADDPDGTGDLPGFFGRWAVHDWHRPVALGPEAPARSRAALTVLTPSAPVRSCTEQVTPGFRDLLAEELYRAWELTEAGAAPDELRAPPPLHRRHAAWALLTARSPAGAPGLDDVVGLLRGRTRALLGALTDAGVADAHAWPHPLASGPDSGVESVRFAIGLGRTPPDAARLAALTAAWTRSTPGVRVEHVDGGALDVLA